MLEDSLPNLPFFNFAMKRYKAWMGEEDGCGNERKCGKQKNLNEHDEERAG